MSTMSSMIAIKTYFSEGCRPVENKELIELKRAISQTEWDTMGADCAAALGVQWVKAA